MTNFSENELIPYAEADKAVIEKIKTRRKK